MTTSPTQSDRIASAQHQLQEIAGRLAAEVRSLRSVARELRTGDTGQELDVCAYFAGSLDHDADELQKFATSTMNDAQVDIVAEFDRNRGEEVAA